MAARDLPAGRTSRWHEEWWAPKSTRSAGARDRDRIQGTTALRRLVGVTQVVPAAEGPPFQNRMTHTLRVAQMARRMAEGWRQSYAPELLDGLGGLDPDVVEAAAIAHDLGHPPFGHTGEKALNELVLEETKEREGFQSNAQSFRILTRIATRDPSFEGLNLTQATLNAVLKYPYTYPAAQADADVDDKSKWGAFESEQDVFDWVRSPPLYHGSKRRSLEAEIMDWADDVTYALHDVEDFFRADLIPLHRLRDPDESSAFLEETFKRWKEEEINQDLEEKEEEVRERFERLMDLWNNSAVAGRYQGGRVQEGFLWRIGAVFAGRYTSGVLKLEPSEDGESAVCRKEKAKIDLIILKELIWHYVIRGPELRAQQKGQREVIATLFETYMKAAEGDRWYVFPTGIREALTEALKTSSDETLTRCRGVTDYICSLTEQQAVTLYQKLTGHWRGWLRDVRT